MPTSRRRLAADGAASEIIGYIFTLGLGALATLVAFQALTQAQDRAQDTAQALTAETIANTVQAALEEAIAMSDSAPNATYTRTVDMPAILDQPYSLEITQSGSDVTVLVRIDTWGVNVTRTIRSQSLSPLLTVAGTVDGTPAQVHITYDKNQGIRLRGGTAP